MAPPGATVIGLSPLRVSAGEKPDSYPATQGESSAIATEDDSDESMSARSDNGEVDVRDADAYADKDEPETNLVQQHESPKVEYEYSSVLPLAVLFQRYDQAYDRAWVETLGAQAKLSEFNQAGLISKSKLVDLMRKGAIQKFDQFELGVVSSDGVEIDRRVKIVGVGSGKEINCPKIRLGRGLVVVKGPRDMTDKIVTHHGDKKAQFNPHRQGWQSVSVWRDDKRVDSLYDIRQRLALWTATVDWFTKENGLKGRKRLVNPHTGQLFENPGLYIKKS
ncbi:MAG: hypothetical protein LQ338_002216 [Usnochroma carphineum]|nr:MAG: hypothetical protein LQ338_002216 [Usnochroma carphineum]